MAALHASGKPRREFWAMAGLFALPFLIPALFFPIRAYVAQKEARQRNVDLRAAFLNGDRPQILQLLKRGADPNQRDDLGQTLLMHAANEGDAGLLAALEQAGARATAPQKLVIAAEMGRLGEVQKLLKQGVAPDAADLEGDTALSYAAAWNRAPIVQLLLQNGADPRRHSREKTTALHWAAGCGSTAAVRVLLKGGASPLVRNAAGQNALQVAQSDCGAMVPSFDCAGTLKILRAVTPRTPKNKPPRPRTKANRSDPKRRRAPAKSPPNP